MIDNEDIHAKLVAFLAGEFARGEGRQCTKCSVVYVPKPGMKGDEFMSWRREDFPQFFEGTAGIEELVSSILAKAEDYCRGQATARFELRTKQHLGAVQRTPFILESDSALALTGGDAAEVGEDGRDQPNQTGIIGQLMRHNEFSVQMTAKVYQASLGTLTQQLTDLANENRALRRERQDHLRQMEEASSQQNERDMEMARQFEADKRRGETLNKLLQLAPLVVNRLIGGNKGEGGSSGLAVIANKLFESFSPDQIALIGQAFRPEQQMLLAELVNSARASMPKSDEEPARAAG